MHSIKIIILGLGLGFIATFVASFGLVIQAVETIKPVLVPGIYVWNFFNLPPNILFLAIINAIIYALIFFSIYKFFRKVL